MFSPESNSDFNTFLISTQVVLLQDLLSFASSFRIHSLAHTLTWYLLKYGSNTFLWYFSAVSTGYTKESLCNIINRPKSDIKHGNIQKPVGEHFHLPGHSITALKCCGTSAKKSFKGKWGTAELGFICRFDTIRLALSQNLGCLAYPHYSDSSYLASSSEFESGLHSLCEFTFFFFYWILFFQM